jgi:hypothetical protein
MVIGSRIRNKASSSSRTVNHSGSKLNTTGHWVAFRERLGATAIGTRKEATNADFDRQLRGVQLLVGGLFLLLLTILVYLYRLHCC